MTLPDDDLDPLDTAGADAYAAARLVILAKIVEDLEHVGPECSGEMQRVIAPVAAGLNPAVIARAARLARSASGRSATIADASVRLAAVAGLTRH